MNCHRVSRSLILGLISSAIVLLSSAGLTAQVTDTTVCEVLKNPASFNNKIVRIKATVSAGFEQFILKGDDCGQTVNGIWLAYPDGTKAKSGPVAILQLQPARNFAGSVAKVERAPVTLEKNGDFKQFDGLLSAAAKVKGVCLGCVRNEVEATLVGRLDATQPALRRDAAGKIVAISGYGNLNAYSAQLVLQSVSGVVAKEIDYAKPALESNPGGLVLTDFGTESIASLGAQPKRAMEAYGKEGDDNGVMLSGMPAESSLAGDAKGNSASPDGVLFVCKFDFERVKDDAFRVAMVAMGEHISDLRVPEKGMETASAYQLQYRGLVTAALGTIGTGQKSLTLPGGYVVWSKTWADAEISPNTQAAVKGYLKNVALLKR